MRPGCRACLMIVSAALTAPSSAALTPAEVAVIANGNSKDSVSLAVFYAKSRGIPPQNVIAVKTTTAYKVSREEYEAGIRRPIGHALIQRKLAERIRCLCLIWGVPVRVAGAVKVDPRTQLANFFHAEATKAHFRIALDLELLKTVGEAFPAPQTRTLRPAIKLFGASPPTPAKPLSSIRDLRKEMDALLAVKQAGLVRISDAARRSVAARQLTALRLDVDGLHGLIRQVRSTWGADGPSPAELDGQLKRAEGQLDQLPGLDKAGRRDLERRLELLQRTRGAFAVQALAIKRAKGARTRPAKDDASVDSELAALWWGEYRQDKMLPNPLHWRAAEVPARKGVSTSRTLMTARIDGPGPVDAARMIRSSLAVEKSGLRGRFYIDAGGKHAKYDAHLAKLHRFVKERTGLESVYDKNRAVFKPGTCPEAALYVGWYSLRRYVPAFEWVPGAIGWHIASFEASDLRNPNTRQWCARMIRSGVAATIGAVDEPYLNAFPLPEEFFPLLLTGKYTVAECYWRTCPSISWRMTLIAEPLYNPFAKNPQARLTDLPPGLAP